MKARAAIYTRVSTLDQGNGASLTTQKNECARYCQSQGLVVVAEFQDLLSGLKSDRAQYLEMLHQAEARAFDVIVVWKMDRFGRDRLESGFQLRELGRLGVRVESATEPNDSPLLRNILMDFAEEESRRISVRVSANKRTLAQQGKWTGPAPFGYRVVAHHDKGRTLEPTEDAATVTEVFKRYATGRYSLSQLRDYVADRSVATNRPQTRGSIHKILKNPVYAGTICSGRFSRSKIQLKSKEQVKADILLTDAQHLAIVDQDTFGKVQSRLQSNRPKGNGRPRASLLFTGMVWCQCGHRYTGKRVTRGVSYYCNRRNDAGDCSSRSVSETRIRAHVLTPIENLLTRLYQEDFRTEVRQDLVEYYESQRAKAKAANQGVAEQLGRLEKRMRNWLDMVGDGELSREEYAKLRAECEPQIEDLRAQLASQPLESPTVDLNTLFAMSDALEGQPPDDQEWREILEGMVDRIVVVGAAATDKKAPSVIRVEFKPEYQRWLGVDSYGRTA